MWLRRTCFNYHKVYESSAFYQDKARFWHGLEKKLSQGKEHSLERKKKEDYICEE
jgi:hypothetical protein